MIGVAAFDEFVLLLKSEFEGVEVTTMVDDESGILIVVVDADDDDDAFGVDALLSCRVLNVRVGVEVEERDETARLDGRVNDCGTGRDLGGDSLDLISV